MNQTEEFQQQYEAAGITRLIAHRAATLKFQQTSGQTLNEIESQILDYAERGLSQQQELEDLNSQVGEDERRIGLASLLSQAGIQPHTDEMVRQQSQLALATGQIPGLRPEELKLANLLVLESDPRAEPEQTTLNTVSVTPNLLLQSDGVQDDDSSDHRSDELLVMAGKLLDHASEAGITEHSPGMETLSGNHLTISRTGKTIIISGEEKRLVGEGHQVFVSEGMTERDYHSLAQLSLLEPEELLQRTEQRQLQIQRERSQQREAARERTPNLSL